VDNRGHPRPDGSAIVWRPHFSRGPGVNRSLH
jgi:hypothetical protein